MRTVAVGLGIIITIATAMINFAIEQWNADNQLVAAIFFAVGGILYIIGSYYGLRSAVETAVEEAVEIVREELSRRS